ncbi:hypothetical protein [Pedobacter gandavensis]|uniref:Uncharacterized protein n=1 Tax=Pedobacter gandavensis TaxID=2679963 RepID=A0ABR6EZ23_9SPHI|nr:hypothetical protein [Pedobacter gandavensis]MBB2150528.1 hypothetical protein [Pedobacter gandavensis]
MKKKAFPQAPQVGDYIKYEGKNKEVYSIDTDNETFLIDVNGKPVELGGDDWDVYSKTGI